ncbi:MAG: TetR/AcrR family transcriptional regulator [Clostridia bacterium]|nr:TetR/AcrR family transcriptional regulator [Clostridia bacterium]
MKRVEQKEKRRQEILNVSLDLFIQKGYAATRTAEIAKTIGMSEGLFFHYFETKEKLYLTLIDIALSGMRKTFNLADDDPIAFFENVAKFIIENCAKDNLIAKLFVLMNYAENDISLSEDIRKEIKGQRELDQTVKIIEQGQKENSIKSGNPLSLALTFWATIHGVVGNIARNPKLPIPNYEWIVDILRKY